MFLELGNFLKSPCPDVENEAFYLNGFPAKVVSTNLFPKGLQVQT